MLHCVFVQHGHNFTHDLYSKTQGERLVLSQAPSVPVYSAMVHFIKSKWSNALWVLERNKNATDIETIRFKILIWVNDKCAESVSELKKKNY